MPSPLLRVLLDRATVATDLAEDLTVDLMDDPRLRLRAKELLDLADAIRRDLVLVAAEQVVATVAAAS
jgi:hypothetical protein